MPTHARGPSPAPPRRWARRTRCSIGWRSTPRCSRSTRLEVCSRPRTRGGAIPRSEPEVADPRFRSGPPLRPRDAPERVPAAISGALPDPAWEQVWVKPGSEVWRVGSGSGDRYVKVAWDDERGALAAEAERLAWAHDRLPIPTPEVVARADDGEGRSWLVTVALEGIASHDPGWRTT